MSLAAVAADWLSRVGAARRVRLGAPLALALSLSACVVAPPSYQHSSYPYQPAPALPHAQVAPYGALEYGRVTHIEVVHTTRAAQAPSGGGAVAGGVIGAVVGNQFGSGSGRAGATALGVVAGALLGHAIESQQNAARVYESYRITIHTDRNEWREFDVPHPGDLRVGDAVRIDQGRISRY